MYLMISYKDKIYQQSAKISKTLSNEIDVSFLGEKLFRIKQRNLNNNIVVSENHVCKHYFLFFSVTHIIYLQLNSKYLMKNNI